MWRPTLDRWIGMPCPFSRTLYAKRLMYERFPLGSVRLDRVARQDELRGVLESRTVRMGVQHPILHRITSQQKVCDFHMRFKPMQRIEREGMTNLLETWEVTFRPQHLLIIPRTIAHPLHTSGSAPGGLFPCLV